MGWVLLSSGVLINVCGLFIIKGTQTSEHFFLTILGYAVNIIGLYIATQSFKYLDIGMAYAVWSGLGSIIALGLGILLFKETVSVPQISFFVVVVVGVAGMSLTA